MVTGCHIHTATARYQRRGLDEDGFAEATDAYKDLFGALDRLIADCGFVRPSTSEPEDPKQGKLGF